MKSKNNNLNNKLKKIYAWIPFRLKFDYLSPPTMIINK